MSGNEELDFERADYSGAEADQQGAAHSGSPGCSICQIPIAETYFTVNGSFVCAACEGPARIAGPPGSGFTRFMGALLVGSVAAAVASALWMLVTELTGYEIGLIAIAVGWIIGVAISLGNRGVGGLPYQLLAVFLTYTAIVMTYVPMIANELQSSFPEADAEIALEAPSAGGEEGEENGQASDVVAIDPEAAWIVAIPVSYAAPFLGGFENAIGILIIGFGLWQAWTLTRRPEIVWAGPFQLGRDAGP